MQESEMTALNPAQLRFREAQYFYRQFVAHSGLTYPDDNGHSRLVNCQAGE
jgi:hypothetical protein